MPRKAKVVECLKCGGRTDRMWSRGITQERYCAGCGFRFEGHWEFVPHQAFKVTRNGPPQRQGKPEGKEVALTLQVGKRVTYLDEEEKGIWERGRHGELTSAEDLERFAEIKRKAGLG